MLKKLLAAILLLLSFFKCFAFENQYRITNYYENYTPFAEGESQRNNIRTRAVTQANTLNDLVSYIIGVEPKDGTYVYNSKGFLVKITKEDYYAYLTDKDYKKYIENGNIDTYNNFLCIPKGDPIGQLSAPLNDEIILCVFAAIYVLYKMRSQKTSLF